MSGAGSTSVVAMGGGGGEVGYGGYRAPFTAVQWQELEQQAMIYKYMVAGLPIPPDLVMPIRLSLEALSARFFQYPSLGYSSYYGKKFDPEPGRCRRTDGKKWRCSKDAHPDSKYCERHMHRGRNRSRKPVESSQTTTSQSLSTAISHISTNANSGSESVSFQHMPLYSVVSSEGPSFGSNVTKLQMEPTSYWMDNKDFRYIHGTARDNDEPSFSPEASGSIGSLGLGSSTGSATWRLASPQVPSSSSFKQKSDSQLMDNQQYMTRGFETTDATLSKQHWFFGNEIGSAKQEEQNPVHPFFSEWPTTKQSWSNLDDDDNDEGSNKNVFSSTQLSIAIPRATSDFPSRTTYSSNDA